MLGRRRMQAMVGFDALDGRVGAGVADLGQNSAPELSAKFANRVDMRKMATRFMQHQGSHLKERTQDPRTEFFFLVRIHAPVDYRSQMIQRIPVLSVDAA